MADWTFDTDKKPDSGRVADSENVTAIREEYRSRKPRSDRGRTRKQVEAENLQRAAVEVDAMLSPENMEALVCLPADIGLAITGRDLWKLDEKEVKTLSTTAASTAKYFWNHDPKWLALTLFVLNFGMVYGTRFVVNLRENAAEKKAARPVTVQDKSGE